VVSGEAELDPEERSVRGAEDEDVELAGHALLL
jgi:hypothetical protein